MQSLAKNSAYHQTRVIRDWNGVERFIEWSPPRYGAVSERLYVITNVDIDRIDNISQRMYDTPEKWWIVLDYNLINDPFSLEQGDRLRVPTWDWPVLNAIPSISVFSEELPPDAIRLPPYTPPPYKRPKTPVDTQLQPTDALLFNFGFPVPDCVTGMAHFQLQIASDGNFSTILISRITSTSTNRWFFYDPFANNGAGGFRAFPSTGIDASTYATQPVYFQIKESDGLIHGTQYYPRYRVIVDDVDSQWISAPPFVVPGD